MSTPDQSPFDEQFADRVREVFGAYEEPVDAAALERMRAALGPGGAAARRGPDRGPVAGRGSGRGRWGVLAAVLVAAGAGLWALRSGPPEEPDRPAVAASNVEAASGVEAALGVEADEPGGNAPVLRPAESRPSPSLRTERTSPAAAPAAGERGASPEAARAASAPRPASAEPTRTAAAPERARTELPSAEAAPASPTGDAPDGQALPARPPARPLLVVSEPVPDAPVFADDRQPGGPLPVRLVVGTAATFSGRQLAEGAGVAAGLAREWRLAGRLSLSGGAVAAYNRVVVETEGPSGALVSADLNEEPGRSVDVVTQSTVTTLALEVPLDVVLDLARTRRGRLGVGVGVTSALYVAQTFEDEGQRYTGAPRASGGLDLSSAPYAARETVSPAGRLDLGRQLNLTLRLTPSAGAPPLGAEVYARLPLGGLTSRDLPLTTVGFRLRYALR